LLTIPLWLSMDPFSAAEQHTDYTAAKTLQVASAAAYGDGNTKKSLPTDTHRVDKVEVTFTPESVAQAKQSIGAGADSSIVRVKQALEGGLQFDAKTDPQKKLHEGVVGDNEGGFQAYEETPL